MYVMGINFASFYIFTIALFGVCYVVLMFLLQIILFNEWSYLHFVLILCSKVQTLMLNIKPVVIYIANTRPIGWEKLKFADISRKDNTIAKRKKGQLSAKHYTENYRSSSTNTTKNQGPVGFCGDRLFLFVLFHNIIRIPIYMFLRLKCRITNHNIVFVYKTKERQLVWYLISVLFNSFNFHSRSNRIRTFAFLHWNVILYFEHWVILNCYSMFNQWRFDILKLSLIVAHEFKYINWTHFLLRCSCIFA